MKTVTKKITVVVAGILLMVAGVAFSFVVRPAFQIRQPDARYRQIQQGMDRSTVIRVMGRQPEWHDQPLMGARWDLTPLPPAEAARIRRTARYTVSTFILSVTFEVAFDEGGAVVGRHRYD